MTMIRAKKIAPRQFLKFPSLIGCYINVGSRLYTRGLWKEFLPKVQFQCGILCVCWGRFSQISRNGPIHSNSCMLSAKPISTSIANYIH
jgi:hypothetical protein